MINKQDLLQALKDTRRNPSPHLAICSNVRGRLEQLPPYQWEIAKALDEKLGYLFRQWPKYSGNPHCPVPSVISSFSEVDQFNATCLGSNNFWVGEYGALRWELLQFCIGQLENEDHGT